MLPEPRCYQRRCLHLRIDYADPAVGEPSERLVCPAFPHGIPAEIAYGDHPHAAVHPAQVGTTVYTPTGPEPRVG